MTISLIRFSGLLLFGIICFEAGWLIKGWQGDSQMLAVERAAQQIVEATRQRESDIAGTIEARLAELKANQTVIDRGVIREIEKPIYLRVCLEPGAIGLLNAAARGEPARDPAKPAGEVHGSAEPAK